MTCTEEEIYDALDAQLLTLPNIDTPNVAFLGTTYVPQAETPYLATSMPAIKGAMITAGPNGVYQWDGVYQVQCNWPIGAGKQNCLAQSKSVRDLFPNALTLTTANGFFIRCRRATVRPLMQDGAWLRAMVQVPWLLQEVV